MGKFNTHAFVKCRVILKEFALIFLLERVSTHTRTCFSHVYFVINTIMGRATLNRIGNMDFVFCETIFCNSINEDTLGVRFKIYTYNQSIETEIFL